MVSNLEHIIRQTEENNKDKKIEERKYRDWLNPLEAYDDGSVQLITALTIGPSKQDCFFDGTLSISDCNRRIWLSFNIDQHNEVETAETRLEKVAILRRYLDTVETAIKDYQERIKDLPEKRPEKDD